MKLILFSLASLTLFGGEPLIIVQNWMSIEHNYCMVVCWDKKMSSAMLKIWM